MIGYPQLYQLFVIKNVFWCLAEIIVFIIFVKQFVKYGKLLVEGVEKIDITENECR